MNDMNKGHIYIRREGLHPTETSYEVFNVIAGQCLTHPGGWYFRELLSPPDTSRGPHSGILGGRFASEPEALEACQTFVRGLKQ